ncbi:UPF0179 family protein [Candidatus Bathyarchaeota archaeon]|nr:MAG: UPF0179 family protein [Candidatus Bathyarchaeota archaeon]
MKKRIVTLVGKGQAKPGTVFIHRGPGLKCNDCKYAQVCVKNVESGRVYKVVKTRNKTLPCSQYEMEMKVVEVVDAEIQSSLPAKQAIPGAIVTFQTPECEEEECENYEICFPVGLKPGDRCEVLEVTGNLQCPEKFPRKKVVLRLAPAC